jgi:hypothetical protein
MYETIQTSRKRKKKDNAERAERRFRGEERQLVFAEELTEVIEMFIYSSTALTNYGV